MFQVEHMLYIRYKAANTPKNLLHIGKAHNVFVM